MIEPQLIVQFPRVAVSCMDVVAVNAQPQWHFKPNYLIVPKNIAVDFAILDFKIGGVSQFHGSAGDGVPASVFGGDVDAFSVAEDARPFLQKVQMDVPIPLSLNSCAPHCLITLVVRNLNACPRVFWAVLYGQSAK